VLELSEKFYSLQHAWDSYLEFSPAAQHILNQQGETPFWIRSMEDLLMARGAGWWLAEWKQKILSGDGFKQKMEELRKLKSRELVRMGFLEYATNIEVLDSAAALSSLANFCLLSALRLVHTEYQDQLEGAEDTFCILGLGKLGGHELNYSSDIDLVYIYGEDLDLPSGKSIHSIYNFLAQKLTQEISSSSSGSGQMYRVDLRLRPEGDRGPLARSVESCENYYAAFGEIWERLALLKTSYSAGNREIFYEFHQMVQPFCYARDVLPQMLSEIAHLKQRTEAEIVGIEDQDYHVKLGRGGIRDLEFYVQGMQLQYGGKKALLQQSNTIKAIDSLLHLHFIDQEKWLMLKQAYNFWRKLEHRLQIVGHLQTHSIPTETEAFKKIAKSLDYEDSQQLWDDQMEWRKKVRQVYDEFYEKLNQEEKKQIVFQDFSHLFREPQQAEHSWKTLTEGTSDFHVSKRTVNSFQRLLPHLIQSLQTCLRPDLAFAQFISFIEVYGSRSMLYESLALSPKALYLLIKLFDSSRYLSETLRVRPDLFEEVARSGVDEPEHYPQFLKQLRQITSNHVDEARLFKREKTLRIALRWLLELSPIQELHEEYADLAQACAQFAWEVIGKPKLAIIGVGKLGGRELGFGSDLDVLFIGEDQDKAKEWIQFMSDKRSSGTLFNIDVRLRPHAEGVLAHDVKNYFEYYTSSAQTWEIQTLSKARYIAGDDTLSRSFFEVILPIWNKKGEDPQLPEHIREMRLQIEQGRCKSGNPELEFKTGVGGLIDIEFALQYWQMRNHHFEPNLLKILSFFEEKHPKEAEFFKKGYLFYTKVGDWLRFEDHISVNHLPVQSEELNFLARRMKFSESEEFMNFLSSMRQEVREAYSKIVVA
jgi:glutamate-ammonia-ligase adenylyltransferase